MPDSPGLEPFVTQLYRLLLDREPDASGFSGAVKALRTGAMTRGQLARAFASSPEILATNPEYRSQVMQSLGVLETPDADRRDIVSTPSAGCLFLIPRDTIFHRELTSPEGYEPWILPYFLDCCREGMNILDIGASWGAFALPAAKRVGPTGRVFAVEVSAANCRDLLRSARASDVSNVEILPFGVSDRLGSELMPRKGFENNNTIASGLEVGSDRLDDYEFVPVLPIDALRERLPRIDIVKMDIEGMEHRAVLGAVNFLREQKPLLFSEYSPEFQSRGSGVSGAAFLNLVQGFGYEIEILHRNRPRERLRLPTAEAADHVDRAWRRHVEDDRGTHLDLCFHPVARRSAAWWRRL